MVQIGPLVLKLFAKRRSDGNFGTNCKSEIKWESEFTDTDLNWFAINSDIYKVSNNVKLRWFQYRIIHRIIGTNSLLNKIGVKNTNLCTFCHEAPETIVHLFTECAECLSFWRKLQFWISNRYNLDFTLDPEQILFGTKNKLYFIQITNILAKMHIYKQKMSNKLPNFSIFMKELLDYHNEEAFILKKNNKEGVYINRWIPYVLGITANHIIQ